VPLPVAHGLLGATFVAALRPQTLKRAYVVPFLIAALFANAPDFDFLLVFGFHSNSWHRGFTHSIGFGLVVYLFSVLTLGKQRLHQALAYGLAFGSHGILDYLTSKEGSGVELLWPFSDERLILGWWGLSEVPSKLPPSGIIKALALELILFAPLLVIIMLLRRPRALIHSAD